MARGLVLHGLACLYGLLATGRAADDVSVLLQTLTDAKARGIPDEPDPPSVQEEEDAEEEDPIKPGDKMEVVVLEGPTKGSWVKCKVVAPGAAKGTWDIAVAGAPTNHKLYPSVPAAALRRVSTVDGKTDGLLLFWAASTRTMPLVKKNVNYLRETYPGRADIFISHYDDKKEEWLHDDKAWYTENVKFSDEADIPKMFHADASMLYAGAFYPPQVEFAKRLLPELLAKRQYDWVWLLDEDIDFTATNLTKLFDDAQDADALIVAPSVKFEERAISAHHHPLAKMAVQGCNKGQEMCFMHVPQKQCSYRYTNFVEALFPLMRPDAVKALAGCQDCADQIDRIWCSFLAKEVKFDHTQACAILDQVSVTHTNGKTLRKWESAHQLHETMGDVSTRFPDDYIYRGDVANYRCVHAGVDSDF